MLHFSGFALCQMHRGIFLQIKPEYLIFLPEYKQTMGFGDKKSLLSIIISISQTGKLSAGLSSSSNLIFYIIHPGILHENNHLTSTTPENPITNKKT